MDIKSLHMPVIMAGFYVNFIDFFLNKTKISFQNFFHFNVKLQHIKKIM